MFQMPCPEVLCEAGGFEREPHGKSWYEQRGLRETCRRIAETQVASINELTKRGFRVLAVVGMEFSPACAVSLLNRGPIVYREKGIFIEELERRFEESQIKVPFIGVNQRALKKLKAELARVIEGTPE